MSNPSTIDPILARTVEEVSMNALPALRTLHADGWVLRLADGYTRRANAVHPLYAPHGDLDTLIDFCETTYRSQGLKVNFKMTVAACPTNLDEILDGRGYTVDSHTSIQLLDLSHWTGESAPGVTLSGTLPADWLAAYCRMNAVETGKRPTLERILRGILPERRFASIVVAGQVVACGLGVLQQDWVGFYDIVTDSAFRQQGYASRLMAALLGWARTQGAQRAYLQVVCNNPPALKLYEKLGFREAYQYWYRGKP